MQFMTQSPFSALAYNEFLQDPEFLCATGLDSPRIVKNVAIMVGEHKFVVDRVFASLAPWLEASEAKYCCH
jgi:hypothetical protein